MMKTAFPIFYFYFYAVASGGIKGFPRKAPLIARLENIPGVFTGCANISPDAGEAFLKQPDLSIYKSCFCYNFRILLEFQVAEILPNVLPK